MATAAIVRAPSATAGIAGEVCNGLESELEDVGIRTVGTYYVAYTAATPSAAQLANYSATGEIVMQQNPDLVFTCFFTSDTTNEMANVWKRKSWTPKMAVITTDDAGNYSPIREFWVGTDLVRKLLFRALSIRHSLTQFIARLGPQNVFIQGRPLFHRLE
jgi:hypothetical protein